ncbi:hypothetical protein H4S14_003119 [Agrobacterium vitis]|nr:hypothetical protein [Agrobacterium vitis]MBE1439356.1 hypothetical protein [Agrobacterium vitis]
MGPDDRGGPGDGPGGGPGGPGGRGGGPGGFGPSGASRDSSGRGDVYRLPGGRAAPLFGNDDTSGSRWNEEGFFDDDVQNLDHQRALAGVQSGRYRSLKQVIRILGIPASSRIIRMDLRNQHGVDVYSIIVRNASGRVERMTVNAESGERLD